MEALRAHVTAYSLAAAVAGLVALAGCQHAAASFIWVDAVPKGLATTEPRLTIQPGDVISIKVWNQEASSVDRTRVREDGKVSMPFLGDVEVKDEEPAVLAQRLEVRLKAFINNPAVTVVLNDPRPLRVSVMGKVTRPGVYDLDRGAGVLHALAAAGGLTPFGDEDRIFVLRTGYWADDASPARIRFRYSDLSAGKPAAVGFSLRAADVVLVE
jgi:polysaccharide export outer membrane protein